MAPHVTPRPADAPDDPLLRDLSQLDPQRDVEPTAEQRARSHAHLEHLLAAAEVSSTAPAPHRHRRRRVVLGLAAAAAAVAVTGVGVVLPSASTIAYAGAWSAVPSDAGDAAGLAQARECAASWQQQPAGGVSAADVLIAERRGDSSVTVVRKDDGAVLCEAIDSATPTGWEALAPTRAMGADEVAVESQGSTGTWPVVRSSIAGQVGAGVTGIEVLAGSERITASLGGGRWVAWWPGGEGGEVGAVRVVVRTAAGERTVPSSDLFQ